MATSYMFYTIFGAFYRVFRGSLKNVGSLEFASKNKNDDSQIDLLDLKVNQSYMESLSIDPQDEFIAKLNEQTIKKVLEFALKNTQDRSRECYRSLFTVFCINESINIEGLVPLLDTEILEARWKNRKKPTLYEAYLKHHPECEKSSANAISSKMLKDFLNKLYSVLKENY